MRLLILSSCLLFATSAFAIEAEPTEVPDPAAVSLIEKLMKALAIEDVEQSAKEVRALLHRSLLNKAGDDLSPDLRRSGFKKARDNAKLYESPTKVSRVRPTGQTSVGFKETADKGRVMDYLIAKKGAGLPAPVKVFFPEAGGDPKIAYIGSL